MLYSITKAPPSRPRFCAIYLSLRLIALAVIGALLLEGAVHADDVPPLSLAEALRLASTQSLQLAAQRSAITAAEQTAVSAGQLPDPKGIVGIDNLPVTTSDAWSLTSDFMTMRRIGVQQDFPGARKRELKGKLAERITAREQAMLVDVQAALRRDVASAWVDRYFAERMQVVVDQQVAEVQLQIDAMRAGLKTGKTQPADLLTTQLALQMLLDRRAEFDKQAARAKAMLSRWLGAIADRPLAPFNLPAALSEQGTLADHIAHHPHVQALDRQVDVAQTEAALAKAAANPDWSLGFAYQQRGPTFSNMISVQVSIDLPLFQKNRQNRDLAAKLALVDQARDLKEDAIRQHLAEAQAAAADWTAATSRLKRFDESLLPLSRERADAALAAYRGGRGDLTPVLQARRDELDIRLQQLQLTADQARAYAQLLYFLPPEAVK
jgi:outer membrane protein TolC